MTDDDQLREEVLNDTALTDLMWLILVVGIIAVSMIGWIVSRCI